MRKLRTSWDVCVPHSFPMKHSTISTDNDTKGTGLTNIPFKHDSKSLWVPEWNELSDCINSSQVSEYNHFCPYCGNFIDSTENIMGCTFVKNSKVYMSHFSCLNDSKFSISQNLNEISKSCIIDGALPHQHQIKALGDHDFFVTIQIMHPLSSFTYFKSSKRLIFNGKSLIWDFGDHKYDEMLFEPNMVCIPTTEFKVIVSIQDMSREQKSRRQMKLLVELPAVENEKNVISFSSEGVSVDIKGQLNLHRTLQEKVRAINQMNFKYQYAEKIPEDMVSIKKLEIVMKKLEPSEIYSSREMTDFQEIQIKPNKVEKLSWGKSSFYSQEQNPETPLDRSIIINETVQQDEDAERVNRQQLKDYICSHAGSKDYQKSIQHMKPQQVDHIIHSLEEYFPEIVCHEYGNYMFQSLIIVCSLHQRIKILQTLNEKMTQIVCTKQGTFSLQQFISFLTHQEQFSIVCSSVNKKFVKISKDQYGAHFIRKLVKSFPPSYLVEFAEYSAQNLVEMAVDKNGICVLKAFFHAMKNKSGQPLEKAKVQMILKITNNTRELILNQYGNYLIQEGYQMFGEKCLFSIAEKIISDFSYYSLEKYSSNVILKCVKEYWHFPEIYTLLKDSISKKDILSMFRNRQGNRVILEIVEKWEEFPLKVKIQQVLQQETSRFNSQKWSNSTRRSRTGTVGTNFKSFSDAIRPREFAPF